MFLIPRVYLVVGQEGTGGPAADRGQPRPTQDRGQPRPTQRRTKPKQRLIRDNH